MANTDIYVNKITLPKDASNTYTAYLVDNVSGYTKTPVMTWYGTSSTTASTAEKAVTCSGYALNAGNIIGVLFSTANTASVPTLNVNSTGAKSIYIGASTPASTTNVLKWSANTMVYFMYDGTYYRYITSMASASVEQPRGANTWYGTSSTTASTQAKTSTINNFILTKGAVVIINFSTANTYTSAKITLNINSTGAKDVYFNNAVTSSTNTLLWDANTTLTFIYDGTGYSFVSSSRHTDNVGTVTSVTASGALSSSGGTTPAITHNAPSTSPAKSTSAVYPITIDSYGHITAAGTAVTIPSVTDSYSSTGTDAVNGKAINAALQTLDSSISSTSGQAISAITITDGKITNSSKINVGEANQNAFSNIKIGDDTISADSSTDTLELIAGTGISLTANTSDDTVTITSTAVGGVTDVQMNDTSIVSSTVANILTNTAYNSSTNKLATMSDIPSVTSTYSSTGTTAVTGTAVNSALQTLDSSISATTGQAISAITITDGKISGSSKISVGEANLVTDVQVNGTSILSSKVANFVTNTAYNSSTNKIATMSDLPSVTSSYSSTGTTAVNGTAVNAALQTLDSSISATTNQAISAVTITDGKITGSSKISVPNITSGTADPTGGSNGDIYIQYTA